MSCSPLDGNRSTSDNLNKTLYQIFCRLTGKHERPSFFLAVLINIHRYTETFANRLAETLHSLCDSTTKVVFMCCPTAFVAFQHTKRLDDAMLLEYDQRFAVLSPKQFVPYDLDEPNIFPESLKGSVELAVVDPPFLNEVNHTSFSLNTLLIILAKVTNHKVVQTLRQILHPTKGKLFLITSTSIEDILHKLYDSPPLGPLRRTPMKIEHDKLVNDFALWVSWDGLKSLRMDTPVDSKLT